MAEDRLGDENIGLPGLRGRPIKTEPVEPGFSYHSESNMDLMQPVLSALAEQFERIGLPLRSIENEWGPGQVECTFAARPALLDAANWFYSHMDETLAFGAFAALRLIEPVRFAAMRTAFAITHLPAILVVAFFPSAPPRWLPEMPFGAPPAGSFLTLMRR